MKITVTSSIKLKTYLFSFVMLLLFSMFCTLPAYSQIDYSYGINKKGFRLGFGALTSSIILTDRTDGLVVPSDGEIVLKTSSQYSKTRTGTFYVVPINFGTNIDLRGLWGNDKVELNPNFQYNFGVNIGT